MRKTPSIWFSIVLGIGCAGSSGGRSLAPPASPHTTEAINNDPGAGSAGAAAPTRHAVGARAQGRDTQKGPHSSPKSEPSEERALGGPPWLGVEVSAREAPLPGVEVESVFRSSPAYSAGVRAGDVLLTLGGRPINTPYQVVQEVSRYRVGDTLAVGFERAGQSRLVRASLTERLEHSEVIRQELLGLAAPELSALSDVQGSTKPTLASMRGKVVVLEFWAPWCAVCAFIVPVLNEWHQELKPQGLELIGITSASVGEAARTAYQLKMEYPLAADESGATTKAYRAMAIPMLVVIDQRGTVQEVLVGYSSEGMAKLRSLIEELIKKG